MNRRQAIRFIRDHGVVLESAKGLEPSLAEKIAGGPIRGGWWSHPKSHEIYELTQEIRRSNAILVCTLAGGRITYVHRRLWPHFIHLASSFSPGSLDQVTEIHLPSGRHKREDVPLMEWVPHDVLIASESLPGDEALEKIELWLERYGDA